MTGSAAQAPWFLARCAQFAVAVAAVAELVRALTVRAHLLHPATTTASDFARVSMIFGDVGIATIVLFLVWFARCRRNAELLAPGRVPGSVTWAVLAWLIPVFNLWVPRGLVQDVHRASAPDGADAGRGDLLVNVWWAAWVGHAALTLAAMNLGYGTSLPLLVAAEALDLLAAVLAIAVIQRITVRQAAGLGAGPQVPTPVDLPHAS
ncbi:DUF4328 domain-containing protein [Streptomyces barringtoniae]|uniref:DUF4328 domain-containing protein n=1 Tax=Streptomyces barringtoniae TaxID=2892029 RepID=UPI001E314118|nr:DUF4328 domain-containing protein [Streptomyces barringtoniae]MCC5477638.1 DUF4328 domain-containing protein [Streptomyces barringtoniae]